MYEKCTRDTVSTYKTPETMLTSIKDGKFWCGTVVNTDAGDVMTGSNSYRAYCTDYHYPVYNGCPETYEPVRLILSYFTNTCS